MKLQYSAIETELLLTIILQQCILVKLMKNTCSFSWVTEIDPEIFADAIHHGMMISIEGIKKVIRN